MLMGLPLSLSEGSDNQSVELLHAD